MPAKLQTASTVNATVHAQDSVEDFSKLAVQKLPIGANVDSRKLELILKVLPRIFQKDKCIDVIISFLDAL